MKTLIALSSTALLLTGATSFAQSQPSAKNSVQLSELTLLDASKGNTCEDILNTTLKTSSQKDIVATVAIEAGLFTDTLVRSKGDTDTSSAEGSVKIKVLVDGNMAFPGEVTFAKRKQTLMAKLGGIETCVDSNGDGVVNYGECTLTEEEIRLILESLEASSFVFALDDVGTGVHNIKVQACVNTATSYQAGSAAAKAWVGKGSLSVEEVRLVKGSDITL
jgi:hypothetical protein